jgi:hypothetical protein
MESSAGSCDLRSVADKGEGRREKAEGKKLFF